MVPCVALVEATTSVCWSPLIRHVAAIVADEFDEAPFDSYARVFPVSNQLPFVVACVALEATTAVTSVCCL